MPPSVTQMEVVGVRGADQHHDVGENAPSGDVVDRGARDGDRSQAAAAACLRSARIRASTGNAVMLMAAPMNSAKLVKATLSSESRGYR